MSGIKKKIYPFLAGIVVCFLSSYAFSAVTHIINAEGKLAGAKNVMVGGILYDVMFKDGKFVDIFGSANGLDATTLTQANLFSAALFDHVLIDTPSHKWDSMPMTSFGCAYFPYVTCSIVTPYIVEFRSDVYGSTALNTDNQVNVYGQADRISSSGFIWMYTTTADRDYQVYADWSPVVVPLPSPIFLFLSSIALLRFFMK